jgi:hypothetical protein
MSAWPTSWSYFVPYQEDISAALQRLREDVFARWEYLDLDFINSPVDWEAAARQHREFADSPEVSQEARQWHLQEAERYKRLHEKEVTGSKPTPPPQPRTIEDLLEEQEDNGTHSILDITSVSARPKFGAVSPFPSSELVEYFDTDKPSRAVIEDRYEWGSLDKFTSKPYQGIYIIAYRDDKPEEIFFAGCSGD